MRHVYYFFFFFFFCLEWEIKIYYQQIHNDGTAASNVYEHKEAVSDVVGTSSQQFRDTVVEHIENGRTYHFWVSFCAVHKIFGE